MHLFDALVSQMCTLPIEELTYSIILLEVGIKDVWTIVACTDPIMTLC